MFNLESVFNKIACLYYSKKYTPSLLLINTVHKNYEILVVSFFNFDIFNGSLRKTD